MTTDRQRVVMITGFPNAAARGLDRYRGSSSLYHDHVDAMEEHAAMSKNLSMPAAEFAHKVVENVTRKNPPAVIKLDGGARLVPLMAMMPKRFLAKVLGKKFGLR